MAVASSTERVMQHPKKIATRHVGDAPGRSKAHARIDPTVARPALALGPSTVSHAPFALIDVSPTDWRILVLWTPDIAVERLARDIRARRCRQDGLRARARDLRAHLRPEIRERARTDFFPALDMGDDGLGPGDRFD
jgi:hypothetical protein